MSTAPLGEILSTHPHACSGRHVVRLHGQLDAVARPSVAATLDDALDRAPEGAAVLVDLSGVSFCDLDGLRTLRAARDRAGRRGVQLTCEGCSPLLRRVAALVGCQELLSEV